MIEVHLLRYALAAAESGSFSRAAEQFRVKQSTLSKRIRFLELRLGVPLFTRSTQGVAPTPSGQKFLMRARSILGDLDALSSDARALASGDQGTLRVGFQGTLAAGDLRATLDAYRAAVPEIEVEAVETGRRKLLERLARGDLDIAILAGDAPDTGHRSLSLWSETLMLGIPHGHALLERDPIYWTDLRGLGFLVTADDPGSLIAAMIAARLTGPYRAPRIVTQQVCRDNLHSLATRDHLSVTAGVAAVHRTDLAFREIHDAFGPTRLEQHLHWREDNDNPALARFLTIATRRYGRPPVSTRTPESERPPREGEA